MTGEWAWLDDSVAEVLDGTGFAPEGIAKILKVAPWRVRAALLNLEAAGRAESHGGLFYAKREG